jgi:hypothetical protein
MRMNNKIVSGAAIAAAVAALLLGGATPAVAQKPYRVGKAKTAKAPAGPRKNGCGGANGCSAK